MKSLFLGTVLGLILGGVAAWGYFHFKAPAAEEHTPENKPEKKEESRVQHGTNGEIFVKLDKAAQQQIGLKVEAPQTVQMAPELKAFGQVVDPSPLAQIMIDGASARAGLDASTKEYQRLKGLYEHDQNISTKVLETAEAAMKRDKILAEAAQTRLVLALGKGAASQPDLPAFVDSLLNFKSGLIRFDLPLGQALPAPPIDGRLALALSEEVSVPASYLGPAATADPQTQGQGFLFWLKTNPPPAGAAMVGWLKLPGEAKTGVLVPRAALLRHEGEHFVYVQNTDEIFERKEVELARPAEKGWLLHEGLTGQEKVVVAGAQLLLSEELKASGGGE